MSINRVFERHNADREHRHPYDFDGHMTAQDHAELMQAIADHGDGQMWLITATVNNEVQDGDGDRRIGPIGG